METIHTRKINIWTARVEISKTRKWISKSENVYYYNAENLDNNLIKKLNKIDNSFEDNIDYYNDIYPKIIITNNNKVVDSYSIKCSGFNCKEYFSSEV